METQNPDLLLESYDYHLPEELIAQRPVSPRDHSRLLIYDEATDKIYHKLFKDLPEFIDKDTTLVLNNSRVFPCRVLGNKTSGAKVEFFFLALTPIEEHTFQYRCLIKSSSKKNIGDEYLLPSKRGEAKATLINKEEDGVFIVELSLGLEEFIEETGKVPIPPYIRQGESDQDDLEDYQTVYASTKREDTGSVAAPTAGLHFTEKVFSNLEKKGVQKNYVTLHVGLGTFRPVKSEVITEHVMHEENFFVEKDSWENIRKAPKRIAVGTTSLRVLESLWPTKENYRGGEMLSTDIFLYPGKTVSSIDGLITNFHLPKSTLLMLVSSLIGRQKTLELYSEAVKERYRFFSYGDAMLVLRKDRGGV